ncbi:hypothetical protein [Streptomyces sp. 3N207]|uniref:hypothetical protein n=1 Tax=Streptomyces sp. 3N207 TaxID=3457417 RepID=UPI003FCFA0E2
MAEWISVYGLHPVGLNAEAMRRDLDTADLWTEAEMLGLSEDEVDAAAESALCHLRVDPTGEDGAIQVRWKPEGRPIQIKSLTGPEAQDQIAETLAEHLPPATCPGLARVRDHVGQARQVVNLEMGIEDAQHLGAALSGLLAFSLAEASDGLVWFFDRDWAAPADRAVTIWTPDE